MFVSFNDFIEYIKQHEINYVNFCWFDIVGKRSTITVESSKITKHLIEEGFVVPQHNGLHIKPDISTSCVDIQCAYPALSVICDEPNFDSRAIIKKALYEIQRCGADHVKISSDIEYYIFDDVRYSVNSGGIYCFVGSDEGNEASKKEKEYGNHGHRPQNNSGLCISQPVDTLFDLRTETIENMKKAGLNPISHQHMCGMGQCMISLAPSDCIVACDAINKAKYIIKGTAASYGKTVTFMPKPLHGVSGSGIRLNISLYNKDKNLICNKDDLSDISLNFIGGILKHIRSIMAFTNSTTNSYKRLLSAHAPKHLGYTGLTDAISAPYYSISGNSIICKFSDSTMNPHLGIASILMAGAYGIVNKIDPVKGENEIKYLSDALYSLHNSHNFLLVGGVFSAEQINRYIERKTKDIAIVDSVPHPAEFELSYSC